MKEDLNLARYRDQRCEQSFARLVEANLDLVLSAANRILCNPNLAEDAAQKVFTKLALKPEKAPTDLPIEAWLHRTTRSIAIDMVRAEETRRRHEKTAAELATMKETDADWSRLSAEIDRALDELPTADRIAIMLRFFKNKTHAQVGAALGVGEDASFMRIQRALKKLSQVLSRRGLTFSAAALAATLPAQAATSLSYVSAELSATIARDALLATYSASATSSALSSILLMKTKTILIPSACAILFVTAVSQRIKISKINQAVESNNHFNTIVESPPFLRKHSSTASSLTEATLLIQVRRLGSIEPLFNREAAFSRWAEQFTDSASILEVAALLKESEGLSPIVHGRASKALIAHWARIDFDGAMEVFTTASLLGEPGPFGSIHLKGADRTLGFELLARAEPEGLRGWVMENPKLVQDLFLPNPKSKEGKELLLATGRERNLSRRISEVAEVFVRNAPFELLQLNEVIDDSRDGIQSNVIRSELMKNDRMLGQYLLAHVSHPEEVWVRITTELKKPLDEVLSLHATVRIAKQIALADPRQLSERFDELASLDVDWTTPYRLRSLGSVLERQKAQLVGGPEEERWLTNLDRYSEALNSENHGEPFVYDMARQDIALLSADLDREGALRWADSISNKTLRFDATSAVVLRSAGLGQAQMFHRKANVNIDGSDGLSLTFFQVPQSEFPYTKEVSGNPIQISEDPSQQEIVRATEEAMRGIDFPARNFSSFNQRPAATSNVVVKSSFSPVGRRIVDDSIGHAISNRLRTK